MTKTHSGAIMRTEHIRNQLGFLLEKEQFDPTGNLEIINACFLADEETIFGELNDYIRRELDWYIGMSLNINHIEEPIPQIWKDISDEDGFINSNYGWCIFHPDNGFQYDNAITALKQNPHSRHGTMIYIRPNMHADAWKNGRRDFMCTYSAQLLIRDDRLHYMVYMRSNDAVFGYKNDRFWHSWVFDRACQDLDIERGDLMWNAASLHVYPRHFDLVRKK